jgi:hypothetical protein
MPGGSGQHAPQMSRKMTQLRRGAAVLLLHYEVFSLFE